MKRLFFALWPDTDSRSQIDAFNQSIDQQGRKLVAENLHITLVFLGNVSDEIAEAVQQQAASISAPSFSLSFDEIDYWRRPRVLCMTCQRQPKPLYQLVNALTRMVEAFPVKLDKRAFRAHITLMRKAKNRPQCNFEPITIHADSFVLVQSVSTENGVRYQVLARWPLTKAS
jgi:2'-5' RNA ligase